MSLRPGLGWVAVLGGVIIGLGGVSACRAQEGPRGFNDPILTYDTGGHSGLIKALIFAPGQAGESPWLISAGADKLINVWDYSAAPPRRVQVIRPLIWRGRRGVIRAAALSPKADGQGKRILAVAGHGVSGSNGNITLIEYPGGTIRRQLLGNGPSFQHIDSVETLAFSPDGAWLASSGLDGIILIWDIARGQVVASARPAGGPIHKLAFTPDGRRLLTGSEDGFARLWSISPERWPTTPKLDELKRWPPFDKPRAGVAEIIWGLSIHPTGRWAVLGHESGRLVRVDLEADPRTPLVPYTTNGGRIQAVAIHPGGEYFAVSYSNRRLLRITDPVSLETDVELRRFNGGELIRTIYGRANVPSNALSNQVEELAFTPDGQRLAIAGGDSRAISIVNVAQNVEPAQGITLGGVGTSVWDVGFDRGPGLKVGFSRSRPSALGQAARSYEWFDLNTRRFDAAHGAGPPAARATLESAGLRLEPVNRWELRLVGRQRSQATLKLDPVVDGQWWSYTLVPHADPRKWLVAVGCSFGIKIFHLNGAPVRFLAGHSGPVYALAPSPDRKWLASGSSDQSIRLWRLAGADQTPRLGAVVTQRGATTVVGRTEPLGLAQEIGLLEGDVITRVTRERDAASRASSTPPPVPLSRFKDEFDNATVGEIFRIYLARAGRNLELFTRKYDSSILNLFPARNGEWVVWMNQGYYDSSMGGDKRHLGWHLNRGNLTDVQTPEYFPIDTYRARFQRNDVLDAVTRTADPAAALQATGLLSRFDPVDEVKENPPPKVTVLDPRLEQVGRPLRRVIPAGREDLELDVLAEVEPRGRQSVRSVSFAVNTLGRAENRLAYEPPTNALARPRRSVKLAPGLNRVSVIATDTAGRIQRASFDVQVDTAAGPRPPAPGQRPAPRRVILSIGAEQFGQPSWNIKYAASDASAVADFLQNPEPRLRVSAEQEFDAARSLRVVLGGTKGEEARADAIASALEKLRAEVDESRLGEGDALYIFLESHLLTFPKADDSVVLGSDATASPTAKAGPGKVAASTIAALLRSASARGCQVVAFLDVCHPGSPQQWDDAKEAWVRSLVDGDVIVFVASTNGPGLRHPDPAVRRGVFAFSMSQSLLLRTGEAAGGALGPVTLAEYQDLLVRQVEDLAGRNQFAQGYLPDTVAPDRPLFSPPAISKPLRVGRR